ncbi:hypothetical protein AAKU58_004239 [Oxalobacteraceae bacterium GrIS 1.18]
MAKVLRIEVLQSDGKLLIAKLPRVIEKLPEYCHYSGAILAPAEQYNGQLQIILVRGDGMQVGADKCKFICS